VTFGPARAVRSRRTWLVLIVTIVVATLGFYAYQFAVVGSAYVAHMLCSGVFVSGRTVHFLRDPSCALASHAAREPGHTMNSWPASCARSTSSAETTAMLFMVIEHFKGGDPIPVYRRFRDHGRMAPDDVRYVNSWVTPDLTTCYQVMESPDRARLDQWLQRWQDIVDFDVVPVVTSPEAQAIVASRL